MYRGRESCFKYPYTCCQCQGLLSIQRALAAGQFKHSELLLTGVQLVLFVATHRKTISLWLIRAKVLWSERPPLHKSAELLREA